MIHYILQTIVFQIFFLLVYDIVLKKETFFNWNRLYLLVTAVLSFILPFIKIERFKEVVSQNFIIALPEVVLGKLNPINNTPINVDASVIETTTLFTLGNLFYLGVFIASIIFLFKLINVLILINKNPKTKAGKLMLVHLIKSTGAFSFFNYVFLGEYLDEKEKEAILKHEMVHVNQNHTIDLLFFEVLRILFWFNPLVYIYQNKMITLHEFIADADAVKHQNKTEYYQNLLSQVFSTKQISFINPFYKQSLIKKRIVMLQKSKSKQVNLLKYVLLIPVVFGMLIYTSTEAQNNSNEEVSVTTEISFYTFYDDKLKDEFYKEYLKFKNKDEAKILLEKDIQEGVLRLFVNDIKNMTSKEQQLYNQKKELLDSKDYFTKLITINNNGTNSIYYIPSKSVLINNRDDSKAIALNEVDLEVGFSVVDQVPVFPSCETLETNEEKRDCMSKNISEFVNKNFNIKLANDLKLTGRQRINTIFKIDTEGNIVDIRSRASHPDLEEEAIRVIKLLPKMLPGEQKDKKVIVPYSLPIIFNIADVNETKSTNSAKVSTLNLDKISDQGNLLDIPFSVVDEAPVFPGCEGLKDKELKDCTTEKVSSHVNINFNTKLAKELGLKGRQRINVIFKIDTEGNIIDVRSRAAHPSLEEEAIRVIKSLPKMIPGEQRGEKVNVSYSLPIIFQVAD
ncbi:TonB protein C-terminal [Flaviramulus basaltis]|uniref:TonB protein C-terminal n=1 Tax=Flaviramulus basaltis TaxID=369401 RepID=A0A1K2IAH7_9FLAO|nr:M56 family metallopeptidase [Flaviramulus basaltis]SFZ89428.1 TonB protein C-terminal [Flaviramulus basaltis]